MKSKALYYLPLGSIRVAASMNDRSGMRSAKSASGECDGNCDCDSKVSGNWELLSMMGACGI